MRTFLAVPIPKQALDPIRTYLSLLKDQLGSSVVWKNPLDWHITLRFLGEINHQQLETMVLAAREIARETFPGRLPIKKLATFPLSTSQHIALHLNADPTLKSLVDKLDGAAFAVGLGKDNRRFRPHITLGKFTGNPKPLPPMQFASFDIPFKELVLYASKMQGSSGHYRVLQTFRFHERGDLNDR